MTKTSKKAPAKATAKKTAAKAAANVKEAPAKGAVKGAVKAPVKAVAKTVAPAKVATVAKADAGDTQANRRWASKLLSILVGVFAVIVLANFLLAYFAVRSNTGVVTENAYEEGLAYNKTLAEQAKEAGLGWNVVRNVADFPVKLVYALSDAQGAPLGGATVHVVARRPMNDAAAFGVALSEFTDGTYSADIAWPQKGQWELEATFEQNGQRLVAHERVNVE